MSLFEASAYSRVCFPLRLADGKRHQKVSAGFPLIRIAFSVVAVATLLTLLPSAAPAQGSPPTIQSVVAALRVHDNSRALALCKELTHTRSDDPRLWTLEGMALEGLGRNEETVKALNRALAINPDYVPALEAMAQLEFQAGSPKARPYLEHLVHLNPDNQTAHAMLASLAFKRKDCGAAVVHFEKSREVISGNSAALAEFGACLARAQHAGEAIPVFQRILELHPDDGNARYNLGLVEFRAQQYQDAINALLPLTQGSQASPVALNLIAAVYEARDQTPQAVAALRRALALAPRNADNYLDLATISLDHGSFKVGADVLDAGINILPNSAPLYLERGVLLVQMGRFQEADADFRKAAALRPAQNYSAVALGISLLQENKMAQSLALVKQRLAKAPDDPVLNYLLAEILIRKGIQPGAPEFNQAVAAAQHAVQMKTDFTAAQDALAGLYLRSGETRRAAETSRLALKSDPGDQSALYHLIVCARKEGDRKELSQLVEKLAQVSAAAQKQEAARNRFRLVEEGPKSSAPERSN